MFKSKKDKEIEILKQRLKILEDKVLDNDSTDGPFCPQCGFELIEASELGGLKKRMFCRKCGDFHHFEWEIR